MAKQRTAASLECSKEADAKGLHGKERKKFRAECKKAAEEKK
jgi:psiF repeat